MLKQYTLPNQIRVIHQHCPGEVTCCGFVIGAGTRDELDTELGIAHFTEHLLFKGTEKRNAYHLLNRMDAVGAEMNAYTTKEETFLYTLCLKKDYERALELMCDMLFHSTFPMAEMEKEREVVLDEINVYEDSPTELIYDEFEKILYQKHPFGRAILGDPDCLKKMGPEQIKQYTQRCYTTDRMVFFSLSSLDEKKIDRLVSKYLSAIEDSSARSVYKNRKAPVFSFGLREKYFKQTHQAHVLYGSQTYHLYDDKRLVLYLLNNILGGSGMNSRLNNLLREHNGLVYTVESNANFYSDTGLFSIYFGSDTVDVERCMQLIDKELKYLCTHLLSDSQLRAAKKQLFGQLAISAENKEGQALSMAKSMLYYNCFESFEALMEKIEAIQSDQLRQVANEVFDAQKMSCLMYV